MKTHNLWIFVLAAFFCGALFCTQASAKVCFVGDSECGSGAEFGAIEPLPNQDLCAQEGYTTLAKSCNNPGGTCPYDARYVKCCGAEYAYQACIFPLETVKRIVAGKTVVDKCGRLYKCQCPAEYGVSSDYAKNNNCQPGGGYCMVNDGTTDQVKYKTCSCDTSVYTDANRCYNNQSEEASCKNEKGEVRKKCYCDRTRFPYAACEYGSKGTICIDSNINREYYQQCKTARERCIEEEFVAENLTQCPKGSRACTSTVSGNKYYCALGDGCPYPVVPQLYKCQFDKGRWCKANGFTQESSTPIVRNEECIDAASGLQGRAEPCTENTDTPIYYYRCKLSCEQRALFGHNKGDLTRDAELAKAGIVAYYNIAGSDKHLYVAKGGVVPTNDMEHWNQIGSRINFASINGIYALCDRSKTDYMECCEERSQYGNRPILKFDGMKIDDHNYFFNKNMSDIAIDIYSSDNVGETGFGEKYHITGDLTWNNVTLLNSVAPDKAKPQSDDEHYWYISNKVNAIIIESGKTLTFTGDTVLDFITYWWHANANNPDDYIMDQFEKDVRATFYTSHIQAEINAKVRFKNAVISGNGVAWNGDKATMIFEDTRMSGGYFSTLGHLWSYWNVGLIRSTIDVNLFRIRGWGGSTFAFPFSINSSAPNDGSQHARYRCHGAYLANSSTLNLKKYYGRLENEYTKIYVSSSSTLNSEKPIHLKGSNSDMICLQNGARARINGMTYDAKSGNRMIYGWNREYTNVGGTPAAFSSDASQEWYNRFKECERDSNGNGKNCRWPTNPVCSRTGFYDDKPKGHDVAYYPNKVGTILCTACNTCANHGMGFN